jgi:hypothetical protein
MLWWCWMRTNLLWWWWCCERIRLGVFWIGGPQIQTTNVCLILNVLFVVEVVLS